MNKKKNPNEKRSECPLSLSLEVWGDRWSLLILRDVLFRGLRTYSEFLEAGEGISTNILADRLMTLEQRGLLLKVKVKSKITYLPTEHSLALLPALLEIILWGLNYDPETVVNAEVVEQILNLPLPKQDRI